MPESYNCPQCGAPLNIGAKECKYCGEVIVYQPQPSQPVQYVQPAYSPPPYVKPVQEQAYEPPYTGSTWLLANILLTIFCCNIVSIIGIVFGAMSSSKKNKGRHAEAKSNANTAKILFIVGLVLGVLGFIISLVTGVLPMLFASLNGYGY